jgi:hypothetical protein
VSLSFIQVFFFFYAEKHNIDKQIIGKEKKKKSNPIDADLGFKEERICKGKGNQ